MPADQGVDTGVGAGVIDSRRLNIVVISPGAGEGTGGADTLKSNFINNNSSSDGSLVPVEAVVPVPVYV